MCWLGLTSSNGNQITQSSLFLLSVLKQHLTLVVCFLFKPETRVWANLAQEFHSKPSGNSVAISLFLLLVFTPSCLLGGYFYATLMKHGIEKHSENRWNYRREPLSSTLQLSELLPGIRGILSHIQSAYKAIGFLKEKATHGFLFFQGITCKRLF